LNFLRSCCILYFIVLTSWFPVLLCFVKCFHAFLFIDILFHAVMVFFMLFLLDYCCCFWHIRATHLSEHWRVFLYHYSFSFLSLPHVYKIHTYIDITVSNERTPFMFILSFKCMLFKLEITHWFLTALKCIGAVIEN